MRFGLLIVDEVGFLPLDAAQATLLFEVLISRCEYSSIVRTSNRSVDQRADVFWGIRYEETFLTRKEGMDALSADCYSSAVRQRAADGPGPCVHRLCRGRRETGSSARIEPSSPWLPGSAATATSASPVCCRWPAGRSTPSARLPCNILLGLLDSQASRHLHAGNRISRSPHASRGGGV